MVVNCRYFVFLYSLTLLSPDFSRAQGFQYQPQKSTWRSFAATVRGDFLHVLASPLRLQKQDGMELLVFSAVTAAFIGSLDGRVDEDFTERDDFYVKPGIGLAKIGEVYDEISSPFVLAGLTLPMLTAGLVFDDQKLLETTRLMVESYLIAGGITFIGKRVVGRARPYKAEGPTSFHPFKFRNSSADRSLPSGHATSVFAMMTVIAKQYSDWWIKIPAYAVATSVAFQRIDSHNHWSADVIVGGAIGYWVGNTLVNRHKPRSVGTSVTPVLFGNGLGLLLSF